MVPPTNKCCYSCRHKFSLFSSSMLDSYFSAVSCRYSFSCLYLRLPRFMILPSTSSSLTRLFWILSSWLSTASFMLVIYWEMWGDGGSPSWLTRV